MNRRSPVAGSWPSRRRTMMPRRVMASIRRMSPLARVRPDSPASMLWSLRRQMIRSPAEASAPSATRTVLVASTTPRWMRSSRIRWESSRQRAQSAAISRTFRPAR